MFVNMYEATDEIDYLHDAIPLVEELSLLDEGILPILSGLLQSRDDLVAADNQLKRVNG